MTILTSLVRTGAASFAIAAALVLAAPSARAEGDTLYGAIIMATNAEHPAEAPPEIRAEAENLHAVFGYNQFAILGQTRKPVVKGTEDWFVSSPKFFLRVDTRNPIEGGYALGLELFCQKKALAEAKVNLKHQTPLFIRGPQTAKGQLIVLLTILEPPAPAGHP